MRLVIFAAHAGFTCLPARARKNAGNDRCAACRAPKGNHCRCVDGVPCPVGVGKGALLSCPSSSTANFRFAHAETVMPFTSLLGIFAVENEGQTLEQRYLSQCVWWAARARRTSSSLLTRRRLASGTDTLLTAMRRMLNELRMAYGQGCGQARGQDAVTPPGVGASNRASPTPPVCDPVLWKDIVATGHVPADVLAVRNTRGRAALPLR